MLSTVEPKSPSIIGLNEYAMHVILTYKIQLC
jgi:hypothetical protein